MQELKVIRFMILLLFSVGVLAGGLWVLDLVSSQAVDFITSPRGMVLAIAGLVLLPARRSLPRLLSSIRKSRGSGLALRAKVSQR